MIVVGRTETHIFFITEFGRQIVAYICEISVFVHSDVVHNLLDMFRNNVVECVGFQSGGLAYDHK